MPGLNERMNTEPGTVYELMTRQKVETLAEDVKEIRDRINNLFWLIAATVVLDVVSGLAGVGR